VIGALFAALIGLFAPLVVGLLIGKRIGVKGQPIALRFFGGAATAFFALICERLAWQYARPFVPHNYLIFVEMFLFVGLSEEIAKISLIYGAVDDISDVDFRAYAYVGLLISGGFAGAENVLYVLHHEGIAAEIVGRRMFTAVPFHLANSVISTFFIYKSKLVENGAILILLCLAISTALHGLYDYLIVTDQLRSGQFLFALGLVVAVAVRLLRRAPTKT
jgi:RsiW-degrading membrane proteinase PrsW (M82 family)